MNEQEMMEWAKKAQPNINWEYVHGNCVVSALLVTSSGAGYYIGRLCLSTEYMEFGFPEPYSRESGYYREKQDAQDALDLQLYEERDCEENKYAKSTGGLPS